MGTKKNKEVESRTMEKHTHAFIPSVWLGPDLLPNKNKESTAINPMNHNQLRSIDTSLLSLARVQLRLKIGMMLSTNCSLSELSSLIVPY